MSAAAGPSPTAARLMIVATAVLWSLGSLFVRLLDVPTALGVHEPRLSPVMIAFYRGLFAGVVTTVLLRRRDVVFCPAMGVMVVFFAAMSGLYLTATGMGAAGNAIFLQNTAPFWVFLASAYVLGEPTDRRGRGAVFVGLLGAVVIVTGGWPTGVPAADQGREAGVLLMGLGSGVAYAGVIVTLRLLRGYASVWLVVLNLLGSGTVLGLFMLVTLGPAEWWAWVTTPTGRQLAFLAVFGAVQMALPYWLFSRGLRTVSPQEAGIITLLEPILNPLWAYLVTPDRDRPTGPMLLGGTLILLSLAWRYVPRRGYS